MDMLRVERRQGSYLYSICYYESAVEKSTTTTATGQMVELKNKSLNSCSHVVPS